VDFDSLTREELIALCRQLSEQNRQLQAAVAKLTQRVAELEKQLGSGGPPPFVKANATLANRKKKEERKKRDRQFIRGLDAPTEVVLHVCERCPDCGRRLAGGSLHRRRQVIEIAPSPVRIIEHRTIGRWCGACRKRVVPSVDLSDQVVGKHRVGVGLMSWVGLLHITARLPLRSIQRLLKALFGLHLGLGELSELLHTLAEKGKGEKERLLDEVRGSPYVHADETGWREDGQNGYLWSFSTPSVRCFVYDKSRSGDVAVKALGEEFDGICVSDFYVAYNKVGIVRQRCWVHYLRDLHKLSEACTENASVQEWVRQVRLVYDEACAYRDRAQAALDRFGPRGDHVGYGVFDRQRQRQLFERKLLSLAHPYLKAQCPAGAPQAVLSQRIESFLRELFVFVEHPAVPSQNNPAERSLRPAVIGRKISGGTRSAKGSQTKTTLMTLFHSWQLQGKDPIRECRRILTAQPA
jgi:transposase